MEKTVIPENWNEFEREVQILFKEPEYHVKIQDLTMSKQTRLKVSLDDLRTINSSFPALVINNPVKAINTLEKVLNDLVSESFDIQKGETIKYKVTFTGNFGRNWVTPRGLNADLVNKLVRVQGIITRMSIVRSKLQASCHYCSEEQTFYNKSYADQYDNGTYEDRSESKGIPIKSKDGFSLTMEYGLCNYKNTQTITIQEMPERTPVGFLPRSIDVVLEEDLIDKVKPGDRVEVVGYYKSLSTGISQSLGVFKTVILANDVYTLINDDSTEEIKPEDIKNIRELSKQQDLIETLSGSLAPSISGHAHVKKAILLMLLGGAEKNLDNGTHLRGDINIMLVGDPSTAKSQLLRSVLNTAPLATATTGRGASGVGLTAAVTIDKETGERHLEAGAMVLADRGVICIDEFDKMNEVDRVAIHEVMEQQTVTISKAGIHTSLNARCSVLAAANPIYGTYMKDKSPAWNISMPDSLLSRFDLLFVVLDQKDPKIDRTIAERVILNHMYVSDKNQSAMDLDEPLIEPECDAENEEDETQVFFDYSNKRVLTRKFLKKYIKFAKSRANPVLDDEAREFIVEAWSDLRKKEEENGKNRIVPITIRTLETLIRLSTAFAKAHLSGTIQRAHCEEAVRLLKFAIFHEEEERPAEHEDPEPRIEEVASILKSIKSSSKKRRSEETGEVTSLITSAKSSPNTEALKKRIFTIIRERVELQDSPTMNIEELISIIRQENKALNREKVLDILNSLSDENKIMLLDSQVALII